MAEVVAEDVAPTGQNDEDYLEVDLGVGHSEPEHQATDAATMARDETIETVTDDFDIEFDEPDEGGDSAYPEPSHTISDDAQNGELGALQDNNAVSEIDYHENEENEGGDKLGQPSAHSSPLHGSVDNENAESAAEFVEIDDEISYDKTVLEAAQNSADALGTRASLEPEVDADAEQEPYVLEEAHQGGTVTGNAYSDVHETEQHHVNDDQSHAGDTVEEHVHDGKAAYENEHSGAHQDHSWNEDHQHPAHGVIATYKGREYELFASPDNNDPETYFFASTEELYCPLSQMFHGIRNILGAELHATDELLLAVEELDLVIGSSSSEEFLEETTMHDILHLYLQLQANDGVTDEPTLYVQLMARSPCEERFRFLKHAAQEGRGLTEFYESPAESDMDIDMDMASDHAYDEESEGDAADSEDELKDEESAEMAHTEGAQESLASEDANTTDEHTAEGETALQGDLEEVGVTFVHEHLNGEASPLEDGDVDEADPEDDQPANDQAEDAREAPGDQYQLGDNGQGDVTYDGDDHDNSIGRATSTTDHQRSDLHLAEATNVSENSEDETGEGLGDVVEQNGSGHVGSDASTTDPQADPSLGIHRETVVEVEYPSAVPAVDDEVPNIEVLEHEGDVDHSLTNDDVPNAETPAAASFGQVLNSKTTSNTSTLQGDEDEIDYDENEAAADEVDLELDAVDEATVDDADEIDWNNDGDEGDANEDPSPTNNLSPGSSAKRIRDTDDGISLGNENGTPAKRQKF